MARTLLSANNPRLANRQNSGGICALAQGANIQSYKAQMALHHLCVDVVAKESARLEVEGDAPALEICARRADMLVVLQAQSCLD